MRLKDYLIGSLLNIRYNDGNRLTEIRVKHMSSEVENDYDVKRTRIKGVLRIYLGYAAGVGKTSAMLIDAREIQKEGVDVLAGYIEPHDRPETLRLMDGLEVLPTVTVNYKGIELKEFDIDGALARRPDLILVDELAHTNAAGSRHTKRYQDVEELLNHGIDVYTTVNVQHLESLYDSIKSIAEVRVNERIPDSVFQRADQVELVDIEPSDLIERLKKGKIYKTEQAAKALEHFFTEEKLVSLREVALRTTADHVSRRSKEAVIKSSSVAAGHEHILVCLAASPSNETVIRSASRMADAFHAEFSALVVETTDDHLIEEDDSDYLRGGIRLAEQLGAQITVLYGDDVAEQIATYAQESQVTKIVLGKTTSRRRLFQSQSLVDRLIERVPQADVHIIPDAQPQRRPGMWQTFDRSFFDLTLTDSSITVGILAFCTLIGFVFEHWGLSEANIIILYMLGVQVNAVLTKGRIYNIGASLLSVLLLNYFFVAPIFSFAIFNPENVVVISMMLAASLITTALTKQVKEQAQRAAKEAARTEVLLETSHRLQQASSNREVAEEISRQLMKLIERPVIFYLVEDDYLSEPQFYAEDPTFDFTMYASKDEQGVAQWVFQNNKHAGATTNTLAGARGLYLAIRKKDQVYGVVGIPMKKNQPLDVFEKSILFAMLNDCALAFEKEEIYESRKVLYNAIEEEKNRANLLRSISHDLRTPLTSISGNADILRETGDLLDQVTKEGLYETIYDDAQWLMRLVENLLAITRMDDGKFHLNQSLEIMGDIVTEALTHLSRLQADHELVVTIEDPLLLVKVDPQLIMQVLVNLVENAFKYTPKGSLITINVTRADGGIRVEVADDGPGILDSDKEHIFDLFYSVDTASGAERRGLGIGLSLCQTIITAHRGEIYVLDNHPSGVIFGFLLQAEDVTQYE